MVWSVVYRVWKWIQTTFFWWLFFSGDSRRRTIEQDESALQDSSFALLPLELQLHVLSFLSVEDVSQLCLVSSWLRDLAALSVKALDKNNAKYARMFPNIAVLEMENFLHVEVLRTLTGLQQLKLEDCVAVSDVEIGNMTSLQSLHVQVLEKFCCSIFKNTVAGEFCNCRSRIWWAGFVCVSHGAESTSELEF